MGGRGGASGGNRLGRTSLEESILSKSPIVRVKYSEYKNELKGFGTQEGSYNASDKTIGVNVGRGIHAIMQEMPDSYVKEANSDGSYDYKVSKARVATDLYNAIVAEGWKPEAKDPAWLKKSINIAHATRELDRLYGGSAIHKESLDEYKRLRKALKGHDGKQRKR